MSDGYIKFNDLLTAVGNMLKEMGSKEVTINDTDYDLSEFCDKLYKNAYERGAKEALTAYDSNEAYSCDGCRYDNMPAPIHYPCTYCARYYEDKYSNTKGDSE